jgi:hypothetical protein
MCVKTETFPKLIYTKENKISVKIGESKNTKAYAHNEHKCIFSTWKKAVYIIYYKLVETVELMVLKVIRNRSFCCTMDISCEVLGCGPAKDTRRIGLRTA